MHPMRRLLPLLLLATACGAPPRTVESPVELPGAFSRGGAAAQDGRWWRSFGDPALDAAIDASLAGNLSLAAAWARLRQAQATARRAGAPLYPNLDASIGVRRRLASEGAGRPDETLVPINAGLNYEVDLWGRIEATQDAATFEALATAQDAHALAIGLTAQVASAWFQLGERRGQLALLAEQLETNESLLTLVELRFKHGRAEAADVLRQRQLIESVRGERARIEADIAVAAHQLAILQGRAPNAAAGDAAQRLPDPPALPAAGLPAELIQRRPDVRSAFLQVQAADRRVAAAVANRYPRLSLSAQLQSVDVLTFFENWVSNFTANLVAPLFDGGERAADVDRTRAAVDEALHRYGQAILVALGEVEDALARELRQGELITSLEAQLEFAGAAVGRARDRYASGATTYVAILDTVRTFQSLQRTLLSARVTRLQLRIDLHRALAGAITGLTAPTAGEPSE